MEFYPNYEAPMVVMREGQSVIETMRWGFPPPPGVGSEAPVVNVRNTPSAYWRPSIANKAQRCIVRVTAFAEPDRNTSRPVVFRWFRPRGWGSLTMGNWFQHIDIDNFSFVGLEAITTERTNTHFPPLKFRHA
jgi:putative SOS response-associated peptidase YedK